MPTQNTALDAVQATLSKEHGYDFYKLSVEHLPGMCKEVILCMKKCQHQTLSILKLARLTLFFSKLTGKQSKTLNHGRNTEHHTKPTIKLRGK